MAPGTYTKSRFSQIFRFTEVFFPCYSITIFMDVILGELYFVYVIAYFVDINYKYLCFFFILFFLIFIFFLVSTCSAACTRNHSWRGLMEHFSD